MATEKPTHTEIRNGGRVLELTRDIRTPDTINVLVEDTLEGVYRGIDVNVNTLLNALAEIGALDSLIDHIKTDLTKIFTTPSN